MYKFYYIYILYWLYKFVAFSYKMTQFNETVIFTALEYTDISGGGSLPTLSSSDVLHYNVVVEKCSTTSSHEQSTPTVSWYLYHFHPLLVK